MVKSRDRKGLKTKAIKTDAKEVKGPSTGSSDLGSLVKKKKEGISRRGKELEPVGRKINIPEELTEPKSRTTSQSYKSKRLGT